MKIELKSKDIRQVFGEKEEIVATSLQHDITDDEGNVLGSVFITPNSLYLTLNIPLKDANIEEIDIYKVLIQLIQQ